MDSVGQILRRKCETGTGGDINVINGSNDIEEKDFNNGNNVSKGGVVSKYELDRKMFTPNSEKSQQAEEMATKMGDLKNYAWYLWLVNKIGVGRSKQLLTSTIRDIEEKKETKTPVRNKGSYIVWKYKKGFY